MGTPRCRAPPHLLNRLLARESTPRLTQPREGRAIAAARAGGRGAPALQLPTWLPRRQAHARAWGAMGHRAPNARAQGTNDYPGKLAPHPWAGCMCCARAAREGSLFCRWARAQSPGWGSPCPWDPPPQSSLAAGRHPLQAPVAATPARTHDRVQPNRGSWWEVHQPGPCDAAAARAHANAFCNAAARLGRRA